MKPIMYYRRILILVRIGLYLGKISYTIYEEVREMHSILVDDLYNG